MIVGHQNTLTQLFIQICFEFIIVLNLNAIVINITVITVLVTTFAIVMCVCLTWLCNI